MDIVDPLALYPWIPVTASNAGLFISRGHGRHPERVIDSYELIFVSQGQLGMFEADRRFVLSAGQTLILWPGRRHGGTTPYPADLQFYWLHFAVHATTTGAEAGITVPQVATLRQPERIIQLFRWFLDAQESAETLSSLSVDLLVLQMLQEVAVADADERSESSSTAVVLAQQAERYLHTHFHIPISTADIARALDCNPDYLGRIYHRVYGTTMTEALHRRRLRLACALLLDSAHTVAEVAQACGFSDPAYFRRTFLRQQGMSPRAYRRLYARLHVNTE
jgi:AraC-like DNA-binding protein